MEQEINKLHNRHVAKILSKLKQINTAEIIMDAVKRQMSFYTDDIKEQVLTRNSNNYDKFKK